MDKIAVFPGSFDPITREKRISWLESLYKDVPQIKVIVYSGLTVDFCRQNNAKYILRGLRTSADFEFERTIGLMNKALYDEIETIFLLCDPAYAALSSSIVRDILKNGGDVSNFVPEGINVRV